MIKAFLCNLGMHHWRAVAYEPVGDVIVGCTWCGKIDYAESHIASRDPVTLELPAGDLPILKPSDLCWSGGVKAFPTVVHRACPPKLIMHVYFAQHPAKVEPRFMWEPEATITPV